MGKNTFVTGNPGIGKTTVLLNTVEILKNKGYEIGGMITKELREKEFRKGFEIYDLNTGVKGLLAHENQINGPKLGKYRVNLFDLKNIGATSIFKAINYSDIIVVDEIGPMELFSSEFKDAVKKAIITNKPMIGSIHKRTNDPLVKIIRNNDETEILEVTSRNRDHLPLTIIQRVSNFLKRSQISY